MGGSGPLLKAKDMMPVLEALQPFAGDLLEEVYEQAGHVWLRFRSGRLIEFGSGVRFWIHVPYTN